MADNDAKPPKVFVSGLWIRKLQFADGGSILKLNVKADRLIAWLNQHANEKGYVNIVVQEKRTPDEYGTHSAHLDTWRPKAGGDAQHSARPDERRESPPAPASGGVPDDLPF